MKFKRILLIYDLKNKILSSTRPKQYSWNYTCNHRTESTPIQSRKRFAILSRLHPAEVIITTQNPSASSNLGPC